MGVLTRSGLQRSRWATASGPWARVTDGSSPMRTVPSFLRGRLEYAMDALPVVMGFQPGGTAYGFGFDPWIMKWNFEPHRRISPYIELGGGALISTRQIPLGENTFNFTPTGAIGINVLRGKYHWSIDFRYFHISDAQITSFNPGTDTFGLRVGFGSYSGQSKKYETSSRSFLPSGRTA